MSEAREMHTLMHQGIEIINKIVECLEPADAHIAINKLRSYLEAKAEHTAPEGD